jgi:hypothetical protein
VVEEAKRPAIDDKEKLQCGKRECFEGDTGLLTIVVITSIMHEVLRRVT